MQQKLISLAIGATLLSAGGAMAQEVVKIGYVGPLSGQSAHLGTDTSNGARLAVEDLNAKGFKIDGKPVKFVLMAEDDGAVALDEVDVAAPLDVPHQAVAGMVHHRAFPQQSHVVPAAGGDLWIDYIADSGLTEDRYVQAVETKPGPGALSAASR